LELTCRQPAAATFVAETPAQPKDCVKMSWFNVLIDNTSHDVEIGHLHRTNGQASYWQRLLD
jgi:hypothetical protein